MREPLTRSRIVDAAIELADLGGIGSVSMRKLGERLGVESMSLYRHIAGKEDLVQMMIESVVERFPLPDDSKEWSRALRDCALGTYEVLREHPWASAPLASRALIGPARLRYVDAILDRFRIGGLSVKMAHFALHAYDGHVLGFARQHEQGEEDSGAEVAALRAGENREKYPRIAESMDHVVHDDQVEFELMLDLILEGFSNLADNPRLTFNHRTEGQ